MIFIIIYLGLCFAIAKWAEKSDGTFWTTFLICLAFSPIAGILMIICEAAADRDIYKKLEREEKEREQNERK